MTATKALRSEHETILSVIACLRAACTVARNEDRFDMDTFRQGVDFIRNYADAWHHAKEEVHLFPVLQMAGMPSDGGPIGVMLSEHEVGRLHVKAISDGLDEVAAGDASARGTVVENALAYAALLEAHIAKEDGILFQTADRMLPEDEHRRLEGVYESAIPEGANAETGAEYERLAVALCEKWNLDPDEIRSRPIGGGCHTG